MTSFRKILLLSILILIIFWCLKALFFSLYSNNEYEVVSTELNRDSDKEILDGETSIKKNTLLILNEREQEVNLLDRKTILDSISNSDSIWQMNYLKATARLCNDLNQNEEQHIGFNLFDYFLHNPNKYFNQISRLSIDESDCLLYLISIQIKSNINEEGISLKAIKNLTYMNCESCNQDQILEVYKYIDLAEKLIEE